MYHFSKELSPHEQLGVLSVLMYFNIHIANIWQSNIDSEIKQIRSIHPGLRQTPFFLLRVHLEQLHMLVSTPFRLPLSMRKLHYLNKVS